MPTLEPQAMPEAAAHEVLAGARELAAGESLRLAALALEDACKSLVQAVKGAPDAAEKTRLADAADALGRHVRAAAEPFPGLLREEMGSGGGGAAGRALSFDALELMAEGQVDDTVEIVRAQQVLMTAVEAELVELNALVSALLGLERVNPAANPLRPEVWVRALHKSLARATGSTGMRALWMNHASTALGPHLAGLYGQVCRYIAGKGVAQAAYRVTAPKHEVRRAAEQSSITLRDLKRLLVGASRPEAEPTEPGQTMAGLTMPAAMEALQDMKRMDEVVRRMQERWRQGVWQPEAKPGAEGGSYTPTQTLAREVVRLMVANAAADARLLPQMQETVKAFEPALLRLALHDQRFFTDRKHPARSLLEEVTQRSMSWTRADEPGFGEFLATVQEVVQTLAQMPFEDAEPFEFALQTLRQSWAEAEERTRHERGSMARTLLKADARNHLAAEVAAALRERPDVFSAPLELRRFLLGPWSQVIAAARLSGTASAAASAEALVNDIVWSAQPRLASRNLQRLDNIAAPLLKSVREGLASVGYPDAEARVLVDKLALAHAAARSGTIAAEPAAPPAREGALEWDAGPSQWLSPSEAGQSRLVQEADFAPTQEASGAVRERAAAQAATGAELQPGQFVEVMVRGSWARWRLSWASPHGSMLMFTNAEGRAESMTRQMYTKMVELGAVRPMPALSVIDQALDGVAQIALENSTQQPG